jgi:hypothetical protein
MVSTSDITYYLRYTRQGKQKVENVGTYLADVYQRRRVVEDRYVEKRNAVARTESAVPEEGEIVVSLKK